MQDDQEFEKGKDSGRGDLVLKADHSRVRQPENEVFGRIGRKFVDKGLAIEHEFNRVLSAERQKDMKCSLQDALKIFKLNELYLSTKEEEAITDWFQRFEHNGLADLTRFLTDIGLPPRKMMKGTNQGARKILSQDDLENCKVAMDAVMRHILKQASISEFMSKHVDMQHQRSMHPQ